MKSRMFQILAALTLAIGALPSMAAAQTKPINIALFDPIQIFPESQPIAGLRINLIYGKNVSMVGLDWGLVNAVGTGGFTGLQWGLVNLTDGKTVGFQGGLVNLARTDVEGFQYGWFNSGNHVSGFQLGLVNYAGSMNGLQIGIVNIIKTGGQFPVFPIVNWSF